MYIFCYQETFLFEFSIETKETLSCLVVVFDSFDDEETSELSGSNKRDQNRVNFTVSGYFDSKQKC